MAQETTSSAKLVARRYSREMLTAGALYMGVVFVGVYAINNFELPRWAIIAAALAPVLPALLMLKAYATFLSGIDEFQRRIQTEALLASAAIVGFGSFAYGFLEEWADFPHVPLIWVFPALVGFWGLAACIVRLRYK